MGSDMFLSLHNWHGPEVIWELAHIAPFSREEEDIRRHGAQKTRLEGEYGAQVTVVHNPQLIELSSTEVRAALAQGGEDLYRSRVGLRSAGAPVRYGHGSEAPDAGGAAAHRHELSQAQADAPCAGHGEEAVSLASLRRGRDKGPRGRTAPRLHQEAGYGEQLAL